MEFFLFNKGAASLIAMVFEVGLTYNRETSDHNKRYNSQPKFFIRNFNKHIGHMIVVHIWEKRLITNQTAIIKSWLYLEW